MPALAAPIPPAGAPPNVWRDLGLAVAIGVACYALSCMLVAPAAEPVSFGVQWRAMSDAPFELRGQFPQRMLAPLLAWATGLGGPHYVLFARGLCVLLLVTVAFFCRRHRARAADTVLVTLAVALTAAVQMYKQVWPGYVDPLGFALFFAMWLTATRPVVFWSLFLANLLNHELAAFLLPWAWFVRREANGDRRADALGAALALVVYGAFYLWVRSAAPGQKYNADYFFTNPMFPGGTVVIVSLAVTHVVVAFGPVLAVPAWHQHVRSHGRERLHLWLVLAGILAIFCIAWDWNRHSNLLVLPFVLASVRFLAAGHRAVYAGLVALGAALMSLIPPWTTASQPIATVADLNVLLATDAAVRNPVTQEPMGGRLGDVLTRWIPEVAPVLATIVAILAGIWIAGALFARWRPGPPAPPVAPAPATADRAV
jgi:hypothetical protein